jgi:O-antigen ligase
VRIPDAAVQTIELSTVGLWSKVRHLGPALIVAFLATEFALIPGNKARIVAGAAMVFLALLCWAFLDFGRWILLFFASAILLPPLPVSIGNSGPHVSLVFAAIGLLLGGMHLYQWKRWSGPLPLALTVFTAGLLCSLVFAAVLSGAEVAGASFIRVLLFAIGPYVLFYTLWGPASQIRSNPVLTTRVLFYCAVAASAFACLDYYFQFPAPAGYGPQFVWLSDGVFRRAQGLFYEASTLGNFCAFFLVMIVIAMFRPNEERPLPAFVLLGGGTILTAALILSSSRASLLNLAVATCTVCFLRLTPPRRTFFVILPSLLGAAIIVFYVFPSFAENYWSRLHLSMKYIGASSGILSGRVDSWRILLDFLADHPWFTIFGIGYKTLPYSDYIGTELIGDNTYLTLLAETGLVGLISFLWLNAVILRSGFRAARSANAQTAFFGTWIFCFWIGEMVQMFSGDLITYWRVLPIYFWVLAVAIQGTDRRMGSFDRGRIRELSSA